MRLRIAPHLLCALMLHGGNGPQAWAQRARPKVEGPESARAQTPRKRLFYSATTLKAPIRKEGFFEALRIGGLTQEEMVKFVEERGVRFKLTDEDEEELRRRGASDALIEAVGDNYRDSPKDAVRLRITSDTALNDYTAYRNGDNFYIVIPNSEAPVRQEKQSDGFRVESRGSDTVFILRLRPGARPRVAQRFNRLDVLFAL